MTTNVIEQAPALLTDDVAGLLTCRQAARKLGISTRTCWRLAVNGDLPAVRLGVNGRWRFPASAIEALVTPKASE
jgi:excisionase family DNA binding protein